MPTQKPKHNICTCKHFKSAYSFVGAGTRLANGRVQGIGHCEVPNCACAEFLSRYDAGVAKEKARFEALLQAERARINNK